MKQVPASLLTLLAGVVITLISLWVGQHHGLLPEPASEQALLVDNFFNIMVTIATALFLVVQGVIAWFVIQFRQRAGDETDGVPIEGNFSQFIQCLHDQPRHDHDFSVDCTQRDRRFWQLFNFVDGGSQRYGVSQAQCDRFLAQSPSRGATIAQFSIWRVAKWLDRLSTLELNYSKYCSKSLDFGDGFSL
jgi:hypothetical protein